MVSTTVPMETNGHRVEEHTSGKASEVPEQHHDAAAPVESQVAAATATAATTEKMAPVAPTVNFWNVRKETMKPTAEAEAEKRVESIIENIKEVTLGKCAYNTLVVDVSALDPLTIERRL